MKVLIIEDERPARENLIQLLRELRTDIEVVAELDSVKKSVSWLKENKHGAELIFLDIHLADDLSFNIFEQVKVDIPIIFTTAYDEYALKAFKVNSVDYLLKPIDKEELEYALDKFMQLRNSSTINFAQLHRVLNEKSKANYQRRFLVKRGEKVSSVKTEDIAYFEGEDRYVFLVKKEGGRYIVDYKLSDLEKELDPNTFFRLNRSFIAHFDAINNIFSLSKSRMKVDLAPKASREIIVSSENTRRFKLWLNA